MQHKNITLSLVLFFYAFNVQSQITTMDNNGRIVLSENFETSTKYFWIGTNAISIARLDYGQYYYETTTSESGIVSFDFPLSYNKDDYEISFRIKYISGKRNAAAGIVFGYNNSSHQRQILGISDDGQFIISEYDGGKFNHFKDWTISKLIRSADYNILTIRKIDDLIFFFINGTLVHKMAYEQVYGDRIGLQIPGDSRYYLDDFVVKQLDHHYSWQRILYDDFEKSSIFLLGSDNYYKAKLEKGFYSLETTTTGYETWKLIDIKQNRDFEISCKVKFISGTNNSGIGIQWGQNIQTNNKFAFYITGNGHYGVFEKSNSEWKPFLKYTPSTLVEKTKFNLLQVKKIKNKYHFFLNGEEVYSMNFIPFYDNYVSITVPEKCKAFFDNFEVRYIDGRSENLNLEADDDIIGAKDNINTTFKRPKLPPFLNVVNLSYTDDDKTNRLDAKETAYIKFTLVNTGKGEAYNVQVITTEKTSLKGITIGNVSKIPIMVSGEKKEIRIPIMAAKDIQTGKANFSVTIAEANGFDADPFEVAISTQAFLTPKVAVASHQFSTEAGGKVRLGIPLQLRFIIQNLGQGEAHNVTCSLKLPENIFPSDETDFVIGTLKSGESKEINFGFFGNKKYSSTAIPIIINVNEKENYAESKTVSLSLDELLVSSNKVEIKAQDLNLVDIKVASLNSDVDKNIPETGVTKPNTYALIIGNEDYSSFQNGLSKEVNVDYALNDARIFKEYCTKTLGIPERQIKLLPNATSGQMNQALAWINNLSKVDNGKAELVFYYSGHGLPDEITKEPYLIPVDVSGSNIAQGVRLADVYTQLTQYPSQKVTVFLDACFSGGARNQGLLAMKSIKVKAKDNVLAGNMVVFTSSSGEESSGVDREKQHGYLTYYLLKKLQETKGDVTYGQLGNYITETVKKETALRGKIQTPQVNYSAGVANSWSGWKMK
jgi:hypothetical protein